MAIHAEEIKIGEHPSRITPAMAGVFLVQEAIEPYIHKETPQQFACGFWLENYDLIGERGPLNITRAEIEGSEHASKLGFKTKLDLTFDPTRAANGEFTWQLKHHSEDSTEVSTLEITPNGVVGAEHTIMQGRLIETKELNAEQIEELQETIKTTIKSPEAQEYMKQRRAKRAEASKALIRFSVQGLGELTKEAYEKEVEKLDRAIAAAGFIVSTMYEPPEPEQFQQDQLFYHPKLVMAERSPRGNKLSASRKANYKHEEQLRLELWPHSPMVDEYKLFVQEVKRRTSVARASSYLAS